MARKMSDEEREYARLRKNAMSRLRYQIKKHNLSADESAELISQEWLLTVSQAREQNKDISKLISKVSIISSDSIMKLIDNTVTATPSISLYDYANNGFYYDSKKGGYVKLSKNPITPEEIVELSEITKQYSIIKYDDMWGIVIPTQYTIEKEIKKIKTNLTKELPTDYSAYYHYEPERNSYVSQLTGEIFNTQEEAEQAFASDEMYSDIQNAVQEGEELLNKIYSAASEATEGSSRKMTDNVISYYGGNTIVDMVTSAMVTNSKAIALKLHDLGEEVLEKVEVAIHYDSTGDGDRALVELQEIFNYDPTFSDAVNQYLEQRSRPTDTGRYFNSSSEEDYLDT